MRAAWASVPPGVLAVWAMCLAVVPVVVGPAMLIAWGARAKPGAGRRVPIGLWTYVAIACGAWAWHAPPVPAVAPAVAAAVAMLGVVGIGLALAAIVRRLPAMLRGPAHVVGLVAAAAGGIAWLQPPAPSEVAASLARPNVLVVTVEGLRPDAVVDTEVAPTFARLVEEGMVYPAVVAVDADGVRGASALWTDPDWVASRRALGVQTAAFLPGPSPASVGPAFDVWDDAGDWPVGVRRLTLGRLWEAFGAPLSTHRRGDEVVDRALAFLGRTRGAWVAWVHLDDPAPPYAPPVPFDTRFVDGGPSDASNPPIAEVATIDPRHGDTLDGVTNQAWVRGKYLGEVAHVDAQVGRLMDFLVSEGLAGKTLVLWTGVEGATWTDGPVWFGRSPAPNPTRGAVPAVVRLPGRVGVGVRVEDPATLDALGDVVRTLFDEEGDGP